MSENKIEYLRPASLEEVWEIRDQYPGQIKYLAGGNFKPTLGDGKKIIVDLQEAGLDGVEVNEDGFIIGGLATLQDVESIFGSSGFYQALSTEFGVNVRNTLSLSNFLAQANGRSPVLVCLLALEAVVYSFSFPQGLGINDYLASAIGEDVVTKLVIPDFKKLSYEGVGRSPKDVPIVSIAAVKRKDASIHVTCGGTIEIWKGFELSELDDDGLEQVTALYKDAVDGWASAAYRQDVGKILLARVLQKLERIA